MVNFLFFKHSHVALQIDGDDEQNRMQVKIHPRVKLVTLGWGQRSNILLNFGYHFNFNDFYTKLCECSHK